MFLSHFYPIPIVPSWDLKSDTSIAGALPTSFWISKIWSLNTVIFLLPTVTKSKWINSSLCNAPGKQNSYLSLQWVIPWLWHSPMIFLLEEKKKKQTKSGKSGFSSKHQKYSFSIMEGWHIHLGQFKGCKLILIAPLYMPDRMRNCHCNQQDHCKI